VVAYHWWGVASLHHSLLVGVHWTLGASQIQEAVGVYQTQEVVGVYQTQEAVGVYQVVVACLVVGACLVVEAYLVVEACLVVVACQTVAEVFLEGACQAELKDIFC